MATSDLENAAKHNMAIIDDYHGIALSHFRKLLDLESLPITVFQDTLPHWTHSETTSEEQEAIVARLKSFSIISTMRERTPFPRELLKRLPNLRLLMSTGTQHSTFDVKAAAEMGIAVVTAPGYGRTGSVPRPKRLCHPAVTHTWALLLGLARNIAEDDRNVKEGRWQSRLAVSLERKALGICGLGRLGSAMARMAVLAFGMKVICWSENLTQERADQLASEMSLPVEMQDEQGTPRRTFKVVSKSTLFSEADVVSLHYVLSERSKNLVSWGELGSMKSNAMLVNTSRGALIDEKALLAALNKGAIHGAALDVFDLEPLPAASPWRRKDWGCDGRSQVLLSPHMGYVEEDLMHAFYEEQAENVERFVQHETLLYRLN